MVKFLCKLFLNLFKFVFKKKNLIEINEFSINHNIFDINYKILLKLNKNRWSTRSFLATNSTFFIKFITATFLASNTNILNATKKCSTTTFLVWTTTHNIFDSNYKVFNQVKHDFFCKNHKVDRNLQYFLVQPRNRRSTKPVLTTNSKSLSKTTKIFGQQQHFLTLTTNH